MNKSQYVETIRAFEAQLTKAQDFQARASLYKKLALENHPDRGGDLENMKALNAAWENVRKMVDKKDEAVMGQVSDYLAEIETLLRELGLSFELTGSWIWVESSDRAKAVKETLKVNGFRWASQKKRWYYPGVPSQSRGKWSMDDIRANYGSRKVNVDPQDRDELAAG